LILKKKKKNLPVYLGLLKKVVIADTCATYANAIFDHYDTPFR
jgi:D-alanyl-lipoteichoic acid acyltransferase DltB (MBOAT superfamily)